MNIEWVIPVEAQRYKTGLEEGFIYHIPMFGVFTKQECYDAGFTPDFEEDKIPYITIDDNKVAICEDDWIVKMMNGKTLLLSGDDFSENVEPD